MNAHRPTGLARQVLQRILPPVLLALLLLFLVAWQVERQVSLTRTEQLLNQQHDRAATLMNLTLDSLKYRVDTIASIDLVRNGLIDPEERYRYLPALFQSLGLMGDTLGEGRYQLLDYLGRELVSNNATGGPVLEDIGSASDIEAGLSILSINAEGLYYAAPVTIHGQIEGSVALSMDPAQFGRIFAGWDQLSAHIALIDGQGRMVASNQNWHALWGSTWPGVDPRDNTGWQSRLEKVILPGQHPLTLITTVPVLSKLTWATPQGLFLISVTLLSLLMIVAAVFLAATMTARPVARFVKDLNRIMASPQIPSQVEVAGPVELRELASAFNQALNRIRHLGQHDTLTGLPNRALFHDRMETALAAARRDDTRLAMIFIDLDRFKPVNDRYGHVVGDKLLQTIAARLAASIRESDTAARLGGDEFVVLLRNIDSLEHAHSVAEKLTNTLSAPITIDGHALDISASIGLALYPDDGLEIDDLYRSADTAMYQAKQQGGDRVAIMATVL